MPSEVLRISASKFPKKVDNTWEQMLKVRVLQARPETVLSWKICHLLVLTEHLQLKQLSFSAQVEHILKHINVFYFPKYV